VRSALFTLLTLLLLVSAPFAQSAPRAHLLGIAHVAFRGGDLTKTAAFYEQVLGYQEPFALKDPANNLEMKFVKVNDLQYLELMPGDARIHGQLDHFAVYTDDLKAMRSYLQSEQVQIVRDIHTGRIGNPFLTVRDPDGHLIEILEYSMKSQTAAAKGKFLPDSRVSGHITHIGVLINSVGSSMKFYRDILGFRETGRGGGTAGQPEWVNLQLPDGTDYVELLPFSGVASPAQLRAQNHLGLATVDVRKSLAMLQSRNPENPITTSVQSGGNLPLRANIFDPDGVRIELMQSSSGSMVSQSLPSP